MDEQNCTPLHCNPFSCFQKVHFCTLPICLGFFSFSKMMSPFYFYLRNPMQSHVFFQVITWIFFLHCSVLLPYNSMFLHLSSIHCSLASSHFFSDVLTQRFEFFYLLYFFTCLLFSMRSKTSSAIHFCFLFLSSLGIYSAAAPVLWSSTNFSFDFNLFWVVILFSKELGRF